MWYKDLNPPTRHVTTFDCSIAVMHCTGVSGTVPLFQDYGHIGTLLQSAAGGASSGVYTHKPLQHKGVYPRAFCFATKLPAVLLLHIIV